MERFDNRFTIQVDFKTNEGLGMSDITHCPGILSISKTSFY
jgi:hypothetical protein